MNGIGSGSIKSNRQSLELNLTLECCCRSCGSCRIVLLDRRATTERWQRDVRIAAAAPAGCVGPTASDAGATTATTVVEPGVYGHAAPGAALEEAPAQHLLRLRAAAHGGSNNPPPYPRASQSILKHPRVSQNIPKYSCCNPVCWWQIQPDSPLRCFGILLWGSTHPSRSQSIP